MNGEVQLARNVTRLKRVMRDAPLRKQPTESSGAKHDPTHTEVTLV
jgi:hypothetical protein